MKYRKKPLIIDAFKWTGGPDQIEDPLWIVEAIRRGEVHFTPDGMIIKTLEGDHLASPGDYIIQGIKGEIYPCKPDIFEATYELIMPLDLTDVDINIPFEDDDPEFSYGGDNEFMGSN